MSERALMAAALVYASAKKQVKIYLFPALLVIGVLGLGVSGCVYEERAAATKAALWEQYRSEHHCRLTKVDSTGKVELHTYDCDGVEHTRRK